MKLSLSFYVCSLLLLVAANGQSTDPNANYDSYDDVDDFYRCAVNEVYSDCGNVCEVNCQNYGTPPRPDPVQNPKLCLAMCACKIGYVRNSKGACVEDKPNVCPGKRSPCRSRNEVYRRCGSYCQDSCAGQQCIYPLIAFNPTGCYCREGYVRESGLTGRCVRQERCP